MKIVTLNLERLQKNRNLEILEKLLEVNADILVLTETNSAINPGSNYSPISSLTLNTNDGINYKSGENRTTIWTKYEVTKCNTTVDPFTSVNAVIKTPIGALNIYGTIIGIFGGNGERFKSDFDSQIQDFRKLKGNVCIAGDLNITLSGYTYPSHVARKNLNDLFQDIKVKCLTSKMENCVDHIALSESFLENRSIEILAWNEDKKLSDHIGICVTLKDKS